MLGYLGDEYRARDQYREAVEAYEKAVSFFLLTWKNLTRERQSHLNVSYSCTFFSLPGKNSQTERHQI